MREMDGLNEKPDYGTWIRKRKIFVLGATALVFSGLAFCGFINLFFLLALLPAVFFLYMTFIVSLNYRLFSAGGGDYQNKIHELLVERAAAPNAALDVGCGNGHLSIRLAKRFPEGTVVGLDYWGNDWEYAASTCERNARLENAANVRFVKGSASQLPFESESFDCVVSCLTFHEVRDVKEKEDCLAEALRVLKPEGRFVFLDLFDDPKHYPVRSRCGEVIAHNGGKVDEDKLVSEILGLPFPLNGKRSLKYARILTGRK